MTRLEVCVDSVDGALAAQVGGAARVELCGGLVEGGTTPSYGALCSTCALTELEVVALIRPRGGDFLYSAHEVEVMRRDIAAAKEAGAAGVALGALQSDGAIDIATTLALVELARPMRVTFHRAFDMTRDPHAAMEALLEIGVDRVLTSGRAPSAPEGLTTIAALVARAGDALEVIPAGGVRPHNVRDLVAMTGARAVHFTAFEHVASGMEYRNEHCRMASGQLPGEYELRKTARSLVESYASALSGLSDH